MEDDHEFEDLNEVFDFFKKVDEDSVVDEIPSDLKSMVLMLINNEKEYQIKIFECLTENEDKDKINEEIQKLELLRKKIEKGEATGTAEIIDSYKRYACSEGELFLISMHIFDENDYTDSFVRIMKMYCEGISKLSP